MEDETRLAARTFASEFAQSDAGGKNERRWDGMEGFEKAAAKKRELPVGRAFREREGNNGRRLWSYRNPPPPDASPKRPFRRTTHAQSLFFRSDENEDEIHFIVKSGTNIATNKDRRGIVFPTAVFRSVAPPNFIESLSSSCYERFPFDFQ